MIPEMKEWMLKKAKETGVPPMVIAYGERKSSSCGSCAHFWVTKDSRCCGLWGSENGIFSDITPACSKWKINF